MAERTNRAFPNACDCEIIDHENVQFDYLNCQLAKTGTASNILYTFYMSFGELFSMFMGNRNQPS
jgi:hypothetical protein